MNNKRFFTTLFLLLALACSALAQQGSPVQTLPFSTPPPVAVSTANCSISGTAGNTTYYYWVVAQYTVGSVAPSGPSCVVTNASNTLSGSNYVVVNWNAPGPGTSLTYAVLRSTSSTFPGTATDAVTASTSSLTQNDQSNSLSGYTFTNAPPATMSMMLNNRDFTGPNVSILDGNGNTTLSMIQTTSGVNGLGVVAGATGTAPLLSSSVTGADANAGLSISSNGTGAISFLTGNNGRNQFKVVNTAGTVINRLTVTGAATTAAPTLAVDTTTDSNVDIFLTPKGTGVVVAPQQVYSVEGSVTVAQINAGNTILAATTGRTLKIVGVLMQAVGGSAAGCTAIQVADTTGTPVVGVSVAVAGLTSGTIVTEATASNVTLTTFLTALTANQGLQIIKTGGSCTTLVTMNYRVFYKINS